MTSIETYVQAVATQLRELRIDNNESLRRLEERSASIEAHIIQFQSSAEDRANLKRQERILIWTSSLNYKVNYNAARQHTVSVPGTGRWFLDGPEFHQWTNPTSGIRAILLQGIREFCFD